MKKKFFTYFYSMVVLFAITLISCSKDENPNLKTEAIDFEMFGIEHNKMLDEYYVNIKPDLKKSEYITELDDVLKTQVNIYTKKQHDSTFLNKTLNKAYNREIDINSSLYEGQENNISNNLKNRLDELDMILMQQGLEHQNRIELVLAWENIIRDDINLSESEKYIALVGSSVARHSIQFWPENISTINNNMSNSNRNNLNRTADGWFDDLWNYSVGCWKEDAKGAVVTGVAVVVESGGTAAPGAPMAIVAGGVANSALYHIDQLIP